MKNKHLKTIKAVLNKIAARGEGLNIDSSFTFPSPSDASEATEALAAVEELERDYVIVPKEFYLTKEQYAAQITFDPDFPEDLRQQYIDETYSADKSEYESIIAAASQED